MLVLMMLGRYHAAFTIDSLLANKASERLAFGPL